ncbi:capsid protein [Spatholobus suberectus]|nr:capsid protein [Spatholobus suberectus]
MSSNTQSYRSGKTTGYQTTIPLEYQPTRKYATGILDHDCVNNRRELINQWATEMSLIIQTDDNTRDDLDLMATLVQHKTTGNVRNHMKSGVLEELKSVSQDGETFLKNIVNLIYTHWIGEDYLTNEAATKQEEKTKAKLHLMQMGVCDLCEYENFHCEYAYHFHKLHPSEYRQFVEIYLHKIPSAHSPLSFHHITFILPHSSSSCSILSTKRHGVSQRASSPRVTQGPSSFQR